MGKPEARVENYLLDSATKHGFLCYKFTSPGRRGVPDRIIIGRGHTVFIETKAPDGEPSKIQKLTIKRMRAAGADVRLCYTRQQVDEFFEEALQWPEIT
jgi:hypothetical protein